jgi:hypothetical protein
MQDPKRRKHSNRAKDKTVPQTIRAAAVPSRAFTDAKLRQRRWRFFQIVFLFTYAGIIFDIITTAMGAARAGSVSQYEQNPIGGLLIGHLGWAGILAAMTAMMLVTYGSLRMVHTRVSPRWIRFFNWFLLIVGAIRWLAVVTAIMYILQPGA